MKRLWSGNDPLRLALLKSELEAKGIRFMVKNEALGVAAGELPPLDIWPEVWVMDEDRFEDARDVAEFLARKRDA